MESNSDSLLGGAVRALFGEDAQVDKVLEFLLILVVGATLMAGAVRWSMRRREQGAGASLLPLFLFPTVVLALYASFAVRMFRTLGGWPEFIGMRVLPEELVPHAELALAAWGTLFLSLLFVIPAGLLLCAVVPGLRKTLPSVGAYAGISLGAMLLTQLAPDGFLHWWYD
jgi:hypothetical protein